MIYIIDDDFTVAETLKSLIKTGLDIESKVFHSLEDCIKDLDEGNRPDLIISDIHMPTGSGLRLIAMLSQKDIKVPVVYVSGHADKIAQDDIMILRKPVSKEKLFEVITSTLPGNKQS